MAAIQPILGFGTTLKMANTTTVGETNFTVIDGIKGTITLPGGRAEIKDTTQHVLGAAKRRSKAAGLADTSNVSCELFYDPDNAQHAALLAEWEALSFRDYEIEFPETTNKFRFRGQLATFTPTAPMDDYIMCNLEWSLLTVDFTVP